MKKIFLILFLITCFFACKNEDLDPRPDLNDSVGAITMVSNQSTTAFDLGLLSTEQIDFTIDVDGFDMTGIESVSVQLIYTDVQRLNNPDPTGAKLDSVHANIELQTLTSFPADVSFTAVELAEAVGFTTTDSLFIGDNFNFIFPITTTDGRTLTTALSSDLCLQPAQPSFGGCNVSVSIICPFVVADAVGTWNVVSDPFGTFVDGATSFDVVAGPGANQITVVNIFNHTNPDTGNKDYDVIFDVDPATGATTVAQQQAWHCDNFGCGFGVGTIDGGGITFSCIGSMQLQLTHRVAAGSFGTFELIMVKP